MPPLNNPKHEQFAHALIQSPTITQAYQDTYKLENSDSARANGARLLANDSVRNRFIELLDKDPELNDEGLNRHLRDLACNAKDGVRLGVVQTVLKCKGILSDGANSMQQNNIAQVMFNKIVVNAPPQT